MPNPRGMEDSFPFYSIYWKAMHKSPSSGDYGIRRMATIEEGIKKNFHLMIKPLLEEKLTNLQDRLRSAERHFAETAAANNRLLLTAFRECKDLRRFLEGKADLPGGLLPTERPAFIEQCVGQFERLQKILPPLHQAIEKLRNEKGKLSDRLKIYREEFKKRGVRWLVPDPEKMDINEAELLEDLANYLDDRETVIIDP